MHPKNCYVCRHSAQIRRGIFETGICMECRHNKDHPTINSAGIMNFISVMGCATQEPNV